LFLEPLPAIRYIFLGDKKSTKKDAAAIGAKNQVVKCQYSKK
jgi:hypothetical protein